MRRKKRNLSWSFRNVLTKECLLKHYIDDGLTMREIADLFRTTHVTVRVHLLKHKIPIKSRTGANHWKWRGGKVVLNNYVALSTALLSKADKEKYAPMFHNGGYRVLEHRFIVAKKIGRPLNGSEVVHHYNGIRTDNRIENLLLLTTNEHNIYIGALKKKILKLERQLKTKAK